MFEVALQRNQIEFVKLFLDHDLSLSDVFRDAAKLPSLYQINIEEVLRVRLTCVQPGRAFCLSVRSCPISIARAWTPCKLSIENSFSRWWVTSSKSVLHAAIRITALAIRWNHRRSQGHVYAARHSLEIDRTVPRRQAIMHRKVISIELWSRRQAGAS